MPKTNKTQTGRVFPTGNLKIYRLPVIYLLSLGKRHSRWLYWAMIYAYCSNSFHYTAWDAQISLILTTLYTLHSTGHDLQHWTYGGRKLRLPGLVNHIAHPNCKKIAGNWLFNTEKSRFRSYVASILRRISQFTVWRGPDMG